MSLLGTKIGQFVEKDPKKTRYSILSHTWDDNGEQTYGDLKEIQLCYAPVPQTQHTGRPGGREGVTSSSRN